jgi:hypothetical protein
MMRALPWLAFAAAFVATFAITDLPSRGLCMAIVAGCAYNFWLFKMGPTQ